MKIKSLENTPLPVIIDCLLDSFSDYFVKMPDDLEYWKNRFIGARVRLDLSFGAYVRDDLVGFIINGIDEEQGNLTAFNTGTGVIEKFRGRRVVDKIYEGAVPKLKAAGIKHCKLEVIQENARAIRVYERTGFRIIKKYLCFKGEPELPFTKVKIEKIDFVKILNRKNPARGLYSWDNSDAALKKSPEGVYECYIVKIADSEIGYFIINPSNGYLPQFELYGGSGVENYRLLFSAVAQVSQKVRINNVNSLRKEMIKGLLAVGLENHIDQYEMEKKI